ncbi:MAG: hypothetical protein ABSB42_02550 [Tepidisphaeraceae bacterium]|jgi:hypothetical protein
MPREPDDINGVLADVHKRMLPVAAQRKKDRAKLWNLLKKMGIDQPTITGVMRGCRLGGKSADDVDVACTGILAAAARAQQIIKNDAERWPDISIGFYLGFAAATLDALELTSAGAAVTAAASKTKREGIVRRVDQLCRDEGLPKQKAFNRIGTEDRKSGYTIGHHYYNELQRQKKPINKKVVPSAST